SDARGRVTLTPGRWAADAEPSSRPSKRVSAVRCTQRSKAASAVHKVPARDVLASFDLLWRRRRRAFLETPLRHIMRTRLRVGLPAIVGGTVGLGGYGTTPAGAATQVFDTTGGGQTYVVPAGVTSITVDVIGAAGGKGSGAGTGGLPGEVQATLAVS